MTNKLMQPNRLMKGDHRQTCSILINPSNLQLFGLGKTVHTQKVKGLDLNLLDSRLGPYFFEGII